MEPKQQRSAVVNKFLIFEKQISYEYDNKLSICNSTESTSEKGL